MTNLPGKFFALILLGALLLASLPALSQAPESVSYQGKLTDSSGNPLADGIYSIRFALYDAVNSGTPEWQETQGVSLSGGIFNVLLGDVTPLDVPFDVPYWLGVKVESDPEMSPRTPLSAVPYSRHASTVGTNGVSSRSIAAGAVSPQKLAAGNDGDAMMTVDGEVQWTKSLQFFTWTTGDDNIFFNRTILDHPDLNGNPNAFVMAQHVFKSQTLTEIGVWYNGVRWTIYLEAGPGVESMPTNEAFNVIFNPMQ